MRNALGALGSGFRPQGLQGPQGRRGTLAGLVLGLSLGLAACGGSTGSEPAGPVPATPAAAATASKIDAPAAVNGAWPMPATAQAQTPATAAPAGLVAAQSALQGDGIAFSFVLDQARTTSAGVFSANGKLVRTLWRGDALGPGTIRQTWDQRDDQGQALPVGDYTIRVAHHNVRYVWDGVVGNTSARAGAAVPHKSFHMPTSLAAGGRQMHYAAGYNEAQNALHGFDLGSPQLNQAGLALVDPFIAATMIAVDGRRLYWANTGGMAGNSFIAAFDLASRAQVLFSAGAAVCLNRWSNSQNCYPNQKYDSVLEHRLSLDSPPTGLAVQKNGRLLAVAYGADGQVRLLDKDSGRLLKTLALPLHKSATNQLAFSPAGDLWVISGSSLLRYSGLDGTPWLAASVTGLSRPLAVAVDAANEDGVWLADGGASQQLKRFDRLGSARATLGRAGGMGGQVQVLDDRLCFASGPGTESTAVEVDADGAVWVVDTCNNRMLRFNPQGGLLNQIGYLPLSYVATVDSGNPTRVFANFLEFAVDYSKPLDDPKSWLLVRNWLAALAPELVDAASQNAGFGGLRNVQTLSNARTYAQLEANKASFIVELRADGTVRQVKRLRAPASGETPMQLYENGDLGYASSDASRQTVLRLPISGFDARGDPVWATQPTTLASVPISSSAPHHRNGVFSGVRGPRFPLTQNGRVVFFDAGIAADSGFHLGAAAAGADSWLWQASPSGPLDGKGSFQTRKNDPNLHYGGNVVLAVGRAIVYGFHGEFYTDLSNGRVGQANKFMHFRDDGLFIGEFGVSSTRATAPNQPGLSGNAFSPTLLRHGNETYLYHNDESTHGGVHRWRLVGLDDIQDLEGRGSVNSTIVLR